MKMLLGVNIDHAATLRNLRGTKYPDILDVAKKTIKAGADSITVHLREDRRHIKDYDVFNLIENLDAPVNLEIAAVKQMIDIACNAKPKFVCIVPEKRKELTTEGGLNLWKNKYKIARTIEKLQKNDIEVSLFVEPEQIFLDIAKEIHADAIEIHTGKYANLFQQKNIFYKNEIDKINKITALAKNKNIKINAGHGLNYHNLKPIVQNQLLNELNIGHAIICQALFDGIEIAVQNIITIIRDNKKND